MVFLIRQDDERLRREIRDGWCYVFDHFWFVNKFCNFPFSAELINDELFFVVQKHGWVQDDGTVLRPEGLFDYFGLRVRIKWDTVHTHKRPPSERCAHNQFEMLEWYNKRTGYGHFTAGNGLGIVTYDSLGESVTVREGVLKSKRIFTRLDMPT